MSDKEWYRKTTWTDNDREDFFAHLNRSRKTSRCQYLSLQGHHLYQTNQLKEISAALELTNLALSEYPEKIFLAELFEQKAQCLNKLGALKEAEENFLLSMQNMRESPSIKINVAFSFGLYVLEHKINSLYKKVLLILDEFNDMRYGIVFPITEYYFYGIKAIILNREGNYKEATPFAHKAIAASEKQFSGLSRHPKVGLVTKTADVFYDELVRIAQ